MSVSVCVSVHTWVWPVYWEYYSGIVNINSESNSIYYLSSYFKIIVHIYHFKSIMGTRKTLTWWYFLIPRIYIKTTSYYTYYHINIPPNKRFSLPSSFPIISPIVTTNYLYIYLHKIFDTVNTVIKGPPLGAYNIHLRLELITFSGWAVSLYCNFVTTCLFCGPSLILPLLLDGIHWQHK